MTGQLFPLERAALDDALNRLEQLAERTARRIALVGDKGEADGQLATLLSGGDEVEIEWISPSDALTALRNKPFDLSVVVVGRAERVLPMSNPRTSHLVRQTLEHEGIEVLTGRSITGVEETAVKTSSEVIPARTLFWAAGTTAPDVIRQLPVQHARNGAVIVDDHLRIPGYPDVYVIGDSAWGYDSATNEPVPPTAQAARQQGYYVGKAIATEYANRRALPYRYATLGHLALLGHYTGVAEVGRIAFTGLAAWIFWHVAYLQRNPSWVGCDPSRWPPCPCAGTRRSPSSRPRWTGAEAMTGTLAFF